MVRQLPVEALSVEQVLGPVVQVQATLRCVVQDCAAVCVVVVAVVVEKGVVVVDVVVFVAADVVEIVVVVVVAATAVSVDSCAHFRAPNVSSNRYSSGSLHRVRDDNWAPMWHHVTAVERAYVGGSSVGL